MVVLFSATKQKRGALGIGSFQFLGTKKRGVEVYKLYTVTEVPARGASAVVGEFRILSLLGFAVCVCVVCVCACVCE